LPRLSSFLILDWPQLFCVPITSLTSTIPNYWLDLEFPIPFLRVNTRTGGTGHYTCRLTYLPFDKQLELRGEILLTWAVTEFEHPENSTMPSTSYYQHRHYPRPTSDRHSSRSRSVEITERTHEESRRQDPRSPRPIASSTDLHPPEEEAHFETVPSSPFVAFTS
jgi:hypothetical protein